MYTRVHVGTIGGMTQIDESPERVNEISIRELRAQLADVLNAAAVHGEITYVTNRGRRFAAVVPLRIADSAQLESDPDAEQ